MITSVHVRVLTDRSRLAEGVSVAFHFSDPEGSEPEKCIVVSSNAEGVATVTYDDSISICTRVTASAFNYWIAEAANIDSELVIRLEPLPKNGPLGWWHRVVGLEELPLGLGAGIRVGVIDTGCSPHEGLRHVRNLGSFVGMIYKPDLKEDLWGHGTHVCGILGGRPPRRGCFGGFAPGADIISLRVVAREDKGSPDGERRTQDSLAAAVEMLAEQGADLINISLGGNTPSKILQSRIREAFNAGVLCICAAGNDGCEPIKFPARFPEAVAVTALGLRDAGVPHYAELPDDVSEADKFGRRNLYLAKSSSFGMEAACCAPGVSIISTAWNDDAMSYVELTGTSMACPAACGTLAGILACDRQYRAMPRDAARARYARAVLERTCEDIGLKQRYQGHGLIRARSTPR